MAPRRRRRGRCGDGDGDDAMLRLRRSPSAAAGDAAAEASSPASASVAAPARASSPASVAAAAGASSSSPAAPAEGRPLQLVYCDDKVMDPEAVVSVGGRARQYQMGDCSVEVTEESLDASQEAICQAMEAMSEGKLEESFEHLTKAILLNPVSAIMYGTRAPGLKPSERVGTGFRGVRWLASGRYQSHFKDKMDVTVGTFDTLEEAVKARVMAMLKVKRSKAKKLKGSKAKKLERSKQEDKLKDDSLRKLEDKCQHLQDKVNEIEVMAEKQQHQLSRKLKEKEELCTNLEQKIKELELEVLHQRLSLLEVKLQEMKFPSPSEEAGSEHGHGWSAIEGHGSAGKTNV